MAERFNWSAATRQVVRGRMEWYDYDPISRVRDLISNPPYPFATRIRDFGINSAVNWAKNLNPIGRERAWYIGAGLGLAESFIWMNLSTEHRWQNILARAVLNITITQGVSLIGRYFADRGGDNWSKQFSRGIGAGGFYGSVFMGLEKIGENTISRLRGQAAESTVAKATATTTRAAATATTRATEVRTSIPPRPTITVEPTRVPTAVPTRVPDAALPPIISPQQLINRKVVELWQNTAVVGGNGNEYLASLAGQNFGLEDTLIDKAMRLQGQTISDLTPTALQAARTAVEKEIQSQVNRSADEMFHAIVESDPNLNTTDLAVVNLARGGIKAALDQWINDTQHQADLSHVALKAINEQATASYATKVAQFVAESQTQHPEYLIDNIVPPGETAGHMLLKMGLGPTWDGTDWPAFVMLRELNPGIFTELRTAMGLSADQFEELIRKLQEGGPEAKEAYATLIKFMGRVEAGKHVKLLSSQAAKIFASRLTWELI